MDFTWVTHCLSGTSRYWYQKWPVAKIASDDKKKSYATDGGISMEEHTTLEGIFLALPGLYNEND